MWQVWQEQPAAPPEMSNLELPRERSRPRRWWILGVDACPILPHGRNAVHVVLYVVGISHSRGRAVASPSLRRVPFAAVVAEEAAKLHAQLGQDAVDVPMMENGRDEAPSEEAEREQLRTLLADASVAALTPVTAGDEDVCLILQAFPFDSKSCGEDK